MCRHFGFHKSLLQQKYMTSHARILFIPVETVSVLMGSKIEKKHSHAITFYQFNKADINYKKIE